MAAQERSLGALLAQEREKGKERALYYLSRTLNGAEINYSPIEKTCPALFFAIDKLRHYMQAFTIHLIAKADPVKYVLSRPIISGRLAKWAIMLQQYDIVYVPERPVKGQALADFLADHPVPSDWKLSEDLPDDEVLFTETSGLSCPSFGKRNSIAKNGSARRANYRGQPKLLLQELEALDEKRLEAQQALECYQARMSKAFDKHVKPRFFQVGDLVIAVRRPIITTRHTGNKFTPKWDGPYVVKEVYTNGAYKIVDQDGLRIGPINGKFLKKFYA
ncbi:uncharacterized protein LOC120076069 [Benincasa hispida]|uniref:uncharacterized protein LOC120076069 n=1 Tax=Benincasa hispida TaxID=102211 RepID=UPI001902B70A|nr:uncharacterized protein LOC120076069 [Benincasa hispida]